MRQKEISMWLTSQEIRYTFDIVPEQLPLGDDVNRLDYSMYHKGSNTLINDRSVYILGNEREALIILMDWNDRANGEYICAPIRITKA